MKALHSDTTARVVHTAAYGQPPGYELPPPPSLPYAPLPQRRAAGPTMGLVLVALAIPGLIVGLLALGGGESSGDEDGGTESEEMAGPTIEGAGYAYAVPEGWEEATNWAHDVAPDDADSAVAVSRPDHGFDTNVLVAAWDAEDVTSLEQARESWLPDDGAVEELETTSIDGVEAVGARLETRSDAGRPIVQVGYLALWNEQLYSIVLSVPVQSESDSQAAFADVLGSWSWADAGQPDATVA